jgi:hypothetical protein
MLLHAVIGDVDVCEPVAVVIGECHSRAMPLPFGNIVTICHANSPRGGTVNQQRRLFSEFTLSGKKPP